MKRSILASFSVFMAFLFLASPVLADELVFRADMLCDTDGGVRLTPFTDVTGSVTIHDDGDFRLKVHGLRPTTEYNCRIVCAGGIGPADAPCSTNAFGKLHVLLPGFGRSGNLAGGCGQPVVTAFSGPGGPFGNAPEFDNHPVLGDRADFCNSGWGLD